MYYYKFKRGKLKALITKAISYIGSERKLRCAINISLGDIYYYKKERVNISEKNLKKLQKLLNIETKNINGDIKQVFPSNWGQKKGAREAYKSKLKRGTFRKNLKKMNESSSIHKKLWHKNMKKNSPEEYYLLQYNNFKKIGGYKLKTNKGEKVRNLLEKKIADYLNYKKINYEYEPLISLGKKTYFPDFKIKDLIIEATMWRGNMKINKLKEKQINFKKKGYNFLLVVSKDVEKYYENERFNTISDITLIPKFLNENF